MKRKTIIGIKDANSLGAKLAKIKIAEYFKDDRVVVDNSENDKIVITQKNGDDKTWHDLWSIMGFSECDVYDNKEVMKYVTYMHHYEDINSDKYEDCIEAFAHEDARFSNC